MDRHAPAVDVALQAYETRSLPEKGPQGAVVLARPAMRLRRAVPEGLPAATRRRADVCKPLDAAEAEPWVSAAWGRRRPAVARSVSLRGQPPSWRPRPDAHLEVAVAAGPLLPFETSSGHSRDEDKRPFGKRAALFRRHNKVACRCGAKTLGCVTIRIR